MLIDTGSLLQPVSPVEPAGPNLEYSPDFAALERATQGTPDRQMGNAILPGQPPDPDVVVEQAISLLQRSKDLRIALKLQRALLARGGLSAFLHAFALLRGLLDEFWDTVHPQLDPEDDPSFTARRNALAALCAPELLRELRRSPLLDSRVHGPVTLQEIATAISPHPNQDEPSRALSKRIEATLLEQDPRELVQWLTLFERALDHLAALTAAFQRAEVPLPEFAPLSLLLRQAALALCQRVSAEPAADPPSPAPDVLLAPAAIADDAQHRAAPAPNSIRDRHDVVRRLDELRAYYRAHEPSSPLPLLLERCQRLATLDFMAIVKDIAPDALAKVELIAGTTASK